MSVHRQPQEASQLRNVSGRAGARTQRGLRLREQPGLFHPTKCSQGDSSVFQ